MYTINCCTPRSIPDTRGKEIAGEIFNVNFGVLKDHPQTKLTSNCSSSPDITLYIAHLFGMANIHSLKLGPPSNRNSSSTRVDRSGYVNFKKASWSSYT